MRVLRIPMCKADVLAVDVAENFIMEKSPELYIQIKNGEIRKMFGRGLKAYDLYNKDVYWRFISECLGYYDDMDKLPDSILDVTYEQIAKQKDMLNWCIWVSNTYIPISEFIR